jgi:hypothetical protein
MEYIPFAKRVAVLSIYFRKNPKAHTLSHVTEKGIK